MHSGDSIRAGGTITVPSPYAPYARGGGGRRASAVRRQRARPARLSWSARSRSPAGRATAHLPRRVTAHDRTGGDVRRDDGVVVDQRARPDDDAGEDGDVTAEHRAALDPDGVRAGVRGCSDPCLVRVRGVADLDEVADEHVRLDEHLPHDGELAAAANAHAVLEHEPGHDVVERLDD